MARIFILCFFFALSSVAFMQPDLNFIRYTTEQGLSNDDVLCICQDQFGFMWFGTKDGCSRFDGLKFKTFQYDKDNPGGIAPGWVNGIVRDKNNDLWFAISGAGSPLMKYDYKKEVFIDMSNPIKEHLNFTGETINCWSIFYDSDGLLWLQISGLKEHLVRYHPESNKVATIETPNRDFIKNFMEDADKNIWLLGQTISVYSKKNDSIISIHVNPDKSPVFQSGNCAFQGADKKIWIGGSNGLYNLSSPLSDSAKIKLYDHDPINQNSLSNSFVYGIAEDIDNNILIGTLNGLCLLDAETEKIFRYYNDELDPESINSNLIRTLYRDKQNIIWVGTSSGVGKLQLQNFKTYSQSLYKNSISHNKVQCVCQGQGQKVWVGTPKGIDIFDRGTGKFSVLASITKNPKGLYGAPLVMSNDINRERMWIGTWRGGFAYYDYGAEQFMNYISKPNADKLSHVFSMYPDSKNRLWIGVTIKSHAGVYLYDVEKESFHYFSHDPDNNTSLSSNHVYHIEEDSEGQIWFGTEKGLNLLTDIKKGVFKRYIGNVPVHHFCESMGKYFWIGTEQGLYRFNKSTQEYKNFNTANGLPDNNVLGVLEDINNNLWLSTNKGLVQFYQRGDSIPEITVFRKDEGIRTGNFLPASCSKLYDGAMLFGGSKGFCLFHPKNVKRDTIAPSVVFTDLRIANKSVKVGDTINAQVLLPQSITTMKQLVLNHKNNEFAVEFAGLQYNMPQHIMYAYKLEGIDAPGNQWRYKKADDRIVEYMNLTAGEYVFKVNAANSYGVWNKIPSNLQITILPPWWEAWWFRLVITISLVIIVILIVKWRTYNLRNQKLKLEKIVEERTIELKETNVILEERKEELEIQMMQMEKMNEELKTKSEQISSMAKKLHKADELKLRFFANISHEFRTPLTLIVGPLEKCLNLPKPIDWNKVNIQRYLHLMHKNSRRLLRLINQLIDFRKIDQHQKHLHISHNNIVEFIHEILNAFSPMAEAKNIKIRVKSEELRVKNEEQSIQSKQLITHHSSLITQFWFDPDVMEKIFYNLISNAIKYTPEGGEILIEIGSVETQLIASLQNQLAIKISDTGIGIKPENIDKIFDRFYTIENKESFKQEGVGIGLSYTKELVELHKGSISVESIIGKGTAFDLRFPIGSDYPENETIQKDPLPVDLSYIRSMIETPGGPDTQILHNTEEPNNLRFKNTLLIVEDSSEMREFISMELQSEYKVLQAKDGIEGYDMAMKLLPDIILSDVMMPGMTGTELCEKLKTNENTSHIPIILLTAKTGEENAIKGLETGADDYITKPFSIDIVKIKLYNLTESRRKLRQKFANEPFLPLEEITSTSIDKNFIQKAAQIVEENLGDPDFSNDQFVSLCRLSKPTVYKKIKSLTNQSVSEFIRSIRLRKAAEFLLVEDKNISEIAYMTGFKDRSVFTRYFTKMFQKSPTQYLQHHQNKMNS